MATERDDYDLYELLGVARAAAADEIRRAYRAKVAELHPDKHNNDPAKVRALKRVNAAYRILGDPDRRAEYDAKQKYNASEMPDPTKVQPPPPRKRREPPHEPQPTSRVRYDEKAGDGARAPASAVQQPPQSVRTPRGNGTLPIKTSATNTPGAVARAWLWVLLVGAGVILVMQAVVGWMRTEPAAATRAPESASSSRPTAPPTVTAPPQVLVPPVPDPVPAATVLTLTNAFTLGSTEDDVRRVMGEPQSVYVGFWDYPSGSVFFSKGKVVGFQNLSHRLRVAMPLPPDYAGQPGVRVGATTDDVLAAQGAPDAVTGLGDTSMWSLGPSSVNFSRGRVVGYQNGGNLKLGSASRRGASPTATPTPHPLASGGEDPLGY